MEVLTELGFTLGETKVYRALLRIGTSSAGPIAKEAGVARSKLYNILERLAQRGLVSHEVRNGVRRFSAAEPSRLKEYLRRRREQLDEQEVAVDQLLPQLQAEYELRGVNQEAEVFEGLEGLKIARERCLKQLKRGDAVYFFVVPNSALERMESYYTEWNERRIKKGIPSYSILPDEGRKSQYMMRKLGHKLTYLRVLPPGKTFYSWAEIFGDTVVIAMNYRKPMSVIITNKYVAESYKAQFGLLWTVAQKP